MPVRTALFFVLLASSAHAAAFDDLKEDLSSCLRFELNTAGSHREVPPAAKAGFALERCEAELDRLERADARRLPADRGLSPSSRSVIQSVLGRANRGSYTGLQR